MKVCLLSSVHPALDVRIFHKEARSLARRGHQVTLIVPHEKDLEADGVRICAVPRPKNRLARMTRTTLQIYRRALSESAQVYHFHDPELISIGLLLLAAGKKVIYDIHEDVPVQLLTKHYLPSRLRKPLAFTVKLIENAASSRFSALIAATGAIASRFAHVNANVELVRNFPLSKELAPRSPVAWHERESAVTYVGSISEPRGIFELVEAMNRLPAGLSASLKLAGHISPTSLRERLVACAGWSRVQELGVIDREELRGMLSSVRAGVVTLHPTLNYVVSEPTKLFEYMSCGIPVIASDFPLWRSIVEGARCGLVVDPLNPGAIARAVEYLLTHDREAEEMGARGRAVAEQKYCWTTEEEKLLGLYARLAYVPEQPGSLQSSAHLRSSLC
jgi:glycosyltransferase involved in cell wall biosynthesis